MVMYGTSVRVGTLGTYQLATPGMELSARTYKRLCSFESNGWIPSSPARACASVKDKTFRWMVFIRGRRREASAGFSRDSRKSFDGAGQGWCNGNGN